MCVWCSTLIIAVLINSLYGFPPDYCLSPINKTDCGVSPTPVFSYFKPGSRCEIEIWRGCPTANRFENEFICSHYCIASLKIDNANSDENKITNGEDPCDGELNTRDCGGQETYVYTYNKAKKACEVAIYRGCETDNMFHDESLCKQTCLNYSDSSSIAKKIEMLNDEQLEKLNNVLEEFLNEKSGGDKTDGNAGGDKAEEKTGGDQPGGDKAEDKTGGDQPGGDETPKDSADGAATAVASGGDNAEAPADPAAATAAEAPADPADATAAEAPPAES